MKNKFYLLCLIFAVSLLQVVASSLSRDTTLAGFAPFPFGTAISMKHIKDSLVYRELAIKEYSSVTPEGAMKMDRIRPTRDTYYFEDGDYVVNFAEQYNKRIHGHLLIRGNVPEWVENFEGDAYAWEMLMKEHIDTVMKHYKGKMDGWDVVCETIDENGNINPDNIWAKKIGNNYIEKAFIYAHQADPDALLFYNDYGHEFSNKRLNGIIAIVTDLKNRGIPIHGIGMQMHTRYNLGDDRWATAINACAATGLKIHISELDISLNNVPMDPNATFTAELAQAQKEKFKFIVETYCALPDSVKYGITTWGIGDRNTWIRGRPEWPLLFDANYRRKPAYYGVIEGLIAANGLNYDRTSMCFTNATTGYPQSYTFTSGDVIHYTVGMNTNATYTCAGSTGEVRPYRIRDYAFIVELKSTSMDSIVIYGRSTSDTERIINKIEVASAKDGVYTDITNNTSIVNSMKSGNCGTLHAGKLNIPVGTFVRFTITLPDNVTPAHTFISELLVFGVSDNGQSTSVPESIIQDKPIKSKQYYNLNGVEVTQPTIGFFIEKITYIDGSIESRKFHKLNNL